jgi:hypothetical protein
VYICIAAAGRLCLYIIYSEGNVSHIFHIAVFSLFIAVITTRHIKHLYQSNILTVYRVSIVYSTSGNQ